MSWSEIRSSINRDMGNPLKYQSEGATNIIKNLSLPVSFNYGASIFYKNEIHILVGSEHYKLSNMTNKWELICTLPQVSGSNTKLVLFNDRIHSFLGLPEDTKHYSFNENTSTWEFLETLPFPLYGSCAIFNNEINVLGAGADCTGHYKWTENGWKLVSTLPGIFQRKNNAVGIGGKLYIYGYRINNYYNGLGEFDGAMWTGRGTCNDSGFVVSNDTNVFYISTGSSSSPTAVYKSSEGTGDGLTKVASFKSGGSFGISQGFGCIIVGDYIYIIGGASTTYSEGINVFNIPNNLLASNGDSCVSYYLPANTEILYDPQKTIVLGNSIPLVLSGNSVITKISQQLDVYGALPLVTFRN